MQTVGSPERKIERTFRPKALTRILAHSQNRGLSEYQRASWLHTGPSPLPRPPYTLPTPIGGREAYGQQPRLEGKGLLLQSQPETGILHQTVSRLPIANHISLGSWMADVHQEGHSLRSAPQRRHTAHLRWCSCGTPGKPSGQDQIKIHNPSGTVHLPSIWSPELLRPGKGTKHTPNQVCALVEYSRT